MEDEVIERDISILRALYFGNHLEKKEVERSYAVVKSLSQEVNRRRKMSECQDCNKREADTIIYDKNKGVWLKVCRKCIDTDNDLVCPFEVL